MKRGIALGFAVAWVMLGCSCQLYPAGWTAAVRGGKSLEGAWEGRWRSEVNGHTGRLRSVVMQKATDRYEFRYTANWARVLSAPFAVECQTRPLAGGGLEVRGAKDLGPLFGGQFSHEGRWQNDQILARYRSVLDAGTLEMTRVKR
jgi:hypothetical protein